jgi:hypothetical protein
MRLPSDKTVRSIATMYLILTFPLYERREHLCGLEVELP